MKTDEDRRFIARTANMIHDGGSLLTISRDGFSLWTDGVQHRIDLRDYCLDPETFLVSALRERDYMRANVPSVNARNPKITVSLTAKGMRLARHILNPCPDRAETGYDGLLGLDERSVHALLTDIEEGPEAQYALLKWNRLYDTTLPWNVNTSATRLTTDGAASRDHKLIACRVVSRDAQDDFALYNPLSVECTGPISLWNGRNEHAAYWHDISSEQAYAIAGQSTAFDAMTLKEQEDVATKIIADTPSRSPRAPAPSDP